MTKDPFHTLLISVNAEAFSQSPIARVATSLTNPTTAIWCRFPFGK